MTATPSSEIGRLARRAFGDRVRVAAIAPLAGDASSRRYLRITLERQGPRTAVVMIASGSGLSVSSDELAVFAEPPSEMPFLNVQRYLWAAGIAVPEVYAAEGDLVLLEDLGDVTLWDAAQRLAADGVIDLYRKAIEELVAIQIAGGRQPDQACVAFQQRFDTRLFLWELEHFLEFGLTDRPSTPAQQGELRRHFEDLAEQLAAEPPVVLAHRDYHSWNLFVHDGRVRVIDFQDALLAPMPYDLATLLNDRATPRLLGTSRERELVAAFLERRRALTGDEIDPSAFRPPYYRFVLQKALKVLGRFVYLEDVKGKHGYRAMLPDTIATVRRSLENLPELGRVRALLAESFPEVA